VRPNTSRSSRTASTGSPVRYRVVNTSLELLIGLAYRVRFDQLTGAPSWVRSERFDIEGTYPVGTPSRDVMLMVQSLLEDRFKLVLRPISKEMQVYALVIAEDNGRLGELLRTSELECGRPDDSSPSAVGTDVPSPSKGIFQPPPRPAPNQFPQTCRVWADRDTLVAGGVPLSFLTNHLSTVLQRPVVDRTGLAGPVDFNLTWAPEPSPEESQSPGSLATDVAGAASLFTAVREQLGLRLESTRGIGSGWFVERVQRPEPN
jgi:uncharacterized protein (TIGR03435 family)